MIGFVTFGFLGLKPGDFLEEHVRNYLFCVEMGNGHKTLTQYFAFYYVIAMTVVIVILLLLLLFILMLCSSVRDKWRKYVHSVANPRIEDG